MQFEVTEINCDLACLYEKQNQAYKSISEL